MATDMNVLLWAVIGYLAGALPGAWILARLAGHAGALERVDRSSGERDAHLVLKEAGAGRAAALAGTFDVLKAFVPTLVAGLWVGDHEAAACAVGALAGHCWPPLLRHLAGRGLSAASGAFLAILPVEMVIAGILTALGGVVRARGLVSTVAFAGIPLIAMWRGQPDAFVLAAWMIFAMIVARRLEGVRSDAAPLWRAVLRRAVFDASSPEDASHVR